MNGDTLRVEDVAVTRSGDTVTLSATVGNESVFWQMPALESVEPRGEPIVAACLVSAMATDQTLELPANAPVDAAFLASIDQLQTIFLRWFPELHRSAVHATTIEPRRHKPTLRMTGYSGGIDSGYAIMKMRDRLDGLVFVDGIEFSSTNPGLVSEVFSRLERTAGTMDLPLWTVTTNAKQVGRALGGKWPEFIGGTLSSIPHALGVAEYWIAGSNSWENLRPYGTHPITDPMWSSGEVQIHHQGAEARRIDKLRALAGCPELLGALRVCFQGAEYNCGVCHKCLQTSAALRALELSTPAMPPLRDTRLLRGMIVEHHGDLVDWDEILLPELPRRDPALARELNRLIRRYRWRQLFRRADTILTGGRARTAIQRARP